MTITHRRTTSVAVALALAASAAPASARPYDLNAPASPVTTNAGHTPSNQFADSSPAIVRITTRDSGFAWGDAGIGAAGGFALSMIGVGGALVISGQRTRLAHPRP